MSMDTVEGNGVAAEAPITDAPAAEAPETTGPADPEVAEDFDERWTGEQAKTYLTKLRKQNEAYRRRWEPIENAFDGLEPGNAQEILSLAGAVKNWDEGTIRSKIASWASGLGMTVAEAKAAAAEVIADATDDGDEPLTKKGLTEALTRWQADQAKAQQAQQAQQAQERRAGEIRTRVTELGYDPAKDAVGHDALWGVANRLIHESHGTLDAIAAINQAHETLDGWRTQIIDEYLKPKRQDAQRQVTPSGVASTAVDSNEPTDLDEASRRARARIASGNSRS